MGHDVSWRLIKKVANCKICEICYFPYHIDPQGESGRMQVEYSGRIFD